MDTKADDSDGVLWSLNYQGLVAQWRRRLTTNQEIPGSSPGGVKSILNSWELSHCDKRGENYRSKSVKKFLAVGAIGHK